MNSLIYIFRSKKNEFFLLPRHLDVVCMGSRVSGLNLDAEVYEGIVVMGPVDTLSLWIYQFDSYYLFRSICNSSTWLGLQKR